MTPNEKIAEAYYLAMGNKNTSEMGKFLHPEIHFVAPLVTISGKENVLEGAKGFVSILNNITIRAICGSGDQVMMAYDLDFPLPIGILRVAALLTVNNNLIEKIELFFDARSFERK